MYSIQHYVIKFVSDLRQVSGSFWVFRFPPPTDRHDINEILFKVALNTTVLALLMYIILLTLFLLQFSCLSDVSAIIWRSSKLNIVLSSVNIIYSIHSYFSMKLVRKAIEVLSWVISNSFYRLHWLVVDSVCVASKYDTKYNKIVAHLWKTVLVYYSHKYNALAYSIFEKGIFYFCSLILF